MKWKNLTADTEVNVGSAPNDTVVTVMAEGTFGGGTLAIGTYAADGTTFVPFTDPAPLTAAGNMQVRIPKGMTIIASLSGSTTPDLNFFVASQFLNIVSDFYD